jgi:hypothetical protein
MNAAPLFAAFAFASMPAGAQVVGPPPDGQPAIVAQKIIRENFGDKVCPWVFDASRLPDGSIKGPVANLRN